MYTHEVQPDTVRIFDMATSADSTHKHKPVGFFGGIHIRGTNTQQNLRGLAGKRDTIAVPPMVTSQAMTSA